MTKDSLDFNSHKNILGSKDKHSEATKLNTIPSTENRKVQTELSDHEDHGNSKGDTRGHGPITSHQNVLGRDLEGSESCKQGPVDLFSRKCTLTIV